MATCRPSSNIGLCEACNRIEVLVNSKEGTTPHVGVFPFSIVGRSDGPLKVGGALGEFVALFCLVKSEVQ